MLQDRGGRRGLPRHPDARPHRARPRAGALRFKHPAADRLRHRPRGARGRGLRAARRRLRPQAGAGGAPRRGRTPRGRGRRPRAVRRRADPGRARRGHPLHQPLRDHPRRGAGRLRPPAHRATTPTSCAPRYHRSPSSGRRPASSGSTGRCSSRSPTCRRCAATPAGVSVVVDGDRAAGEPPAHPRAARRADPQGARGSGRERPAAPPGPRHRSAAASRQRRTPRGHAGDRRRDRARRGLHALAAARAALPGARALAALALTLGHAAAGLPPLPVLAACASGRCRSRGCCWGCSPIRGWCCSAGSTSGAPRPTSATSPTWSGRSPPRTTEPS